MFLRFSSPAACVGYLVAWWGMLGSVVIIWARRCGPPPAWGAARRIALIAACAAGAAGWLWIDKQAEIAVLVRIDGEHGLTLGDILGSLPLVLVPWIAVGRAHS